MEHVKRLIDPFELLYVAVAIATFDHTKWTAAYMFEGILPPGHTTFDWIMWHFKGGLIAIAVDVGMLLTSRFLVKTSTTSGRITLTLAFFVAAMSSFYMQLGYILYRTPVFEMSPGVQDQWTRVLQPLIDARVILLPLALPLLATIYTLARIARGHEQQAAATHEDTPPPLPFIIEAVNGLESGDNTPQLPAPELEDVIDFETLRFYDAEEKRWRGPYKSRQSMIAAMKSLNTRRSRRRESGGSNTG